MPEQTRKSSENMGLLQDKHRSDANWLNRFTSARFHRALHAMMDQISVQSALDAGCGEGAILGRFLHQRYPNTYGLDLDWQRLQYARQEEKINNIAQASLHSLPLPDSAVDVVFCLEVLEHVGDPEAALRELHRITRRYAILSVPNEPFWRIGNMLRGAYWSEWGNTPEHINHWSVWGFRRFAARYFDILDVKTPVTWTFLLAEKKQG